MAQKTLAGESYWPLSFSTLLRTASAAERIAETIQHSAGRSCIFKGVFFVPRMEFRGAGGAVRVAVHPVGERFQPILGNLDVRVYEHEIFKISGVRQLAYSLEAPCCSHR